MASCLRENLSQEAEVDVGTPFGNGRFKCVYRGKYTSGGRAGEDCACKFFKRERAIERAYFEAELKVVEAAQGIVDCFNSVNVIDEVIRLNKPEIWGPEESAGWHTVGGKKCLVEPMISNFSKYNSNTGWTPLWNQEHEDFWIDAMQALSHFSYHSSGGTTLLCDLQGGATPEGFVLTDPIVMSPVAGTFGPCDLGANGISTFFYRHRCNMFCNGDWIAPQDVRTFYPCFRSSSMELPHRPIVRWPRSSYHYHYHYQSRPPLQAARNTGYGSGAGAPASGNNQAGIHAAAPVQATPSQRPQSVVGSSPGSPSLSSVIGLLQPGLPSGVASQAGSLSGQSSGNLSVAAPQPIQPVQPIQHIIKVRLAPYTA